MNTEETDICVIDARLATVQLSIEYLIEVVDRLDGKTSDLAKDIDHVKEKLNRALQRREEMGWD